MKLSHIPELTAELAAGRAIVLVDDEDRENEGDLIVAAELITPEMINFMARNARGLICLTLTGEHCSRLGLKMQVKEGNSRHSTNFTVPIEAAEGITTGISAADRARTILAAVAPDAKPDDLVQPGHIFPCRAVPGGVLERAGHTEAGCDLCRMAGLQPAATIVEIMNEDGTMARRPDLEAFCEQHGLKMGSIADLIRYRSATEKIIFECEQEKRIETIAGECDLKVYSDQISGARHLAFVFGGIDADTPTLVRVHQFEPLHDLAGRVQFAGRWSFADALHHIAAEGAGVLLLLGGTAVGEETPSLHPSTQTSGSPDGQVSTGTRTVGIGSQILRDLGVGQIRLLGAPTRYPSLSGFGLEVVEFLTDPDSITNNNHGGGKNGDQ